MRYVACCRQFSAESSAAAALPGLADADTSSARDFCSYDVVADAILRVLDRLSRRQPSLRGQSCRRAASFRLGSSGPATRRSSCASSRMTRRAEPLEVESLCFPRNVPTTWNPHLSKAELETAEQKCLRTACRIAAPAICSRVVRRPGGESSANTRTWLPRSHAHEISVSCLRSPAAPRSAGDR